MPNIFANIKSDRTDFNTYLDSLPDKQREELLARHERIGLIAPRKDGILTEIGQTAAGETLRLGESIGSTIEESTGYSGMKDYFAQRRALNRQYEPYEGYKAFSLNPTDIARTVTSGVVQSTGALLATAAGAAAGGAAGGLAAGTSVMFSQVYGDRVKEYREIMPEQDEGVVKGLAFLSALGESAIETLVGPEQIAAKIGSQLSARKLVGEAVKETTQSLAKRIGKEAAKNAVTEGAEEVSQDMWDRLVKKLGGVDVKMPSWDEASETFAGGAWSGAFLGGLGGAMEGAGRRNAQRAIYGAEASAPASAEGDAKNNAQTPSSVGLNGGMQNIGSAVSETAVSETDVKNAGKTMSEALLDEFGVKHRRMTDDEISKEGYGYVMRDGEKVYTNGFYSREANEIVINPLNDGEVFTAGHEFKHWIDANHSDLGAVLDGIMDEQFNELGEQGGENAPAPDEFKADIMGYLLKDRTALHDMSVKAEQRQAGFGEKFLHAVIEFCKKVMAFAKENNTIPEAEKYFNDYKAVRDTATTALAELKQRVNGQRNAANNAAMNTDVSQMERAAGNYVSIDELENAVREYEHDKDALRLAGRFIRVSDIQKAIAKYEIGNMTEADWNDAVNNSKDKVALRGVLNKLSADDLNKAAEDYYRVKEEQNTSTPESTVNTPADNVFPVNTHAPTLKDSLQVEEDKAKSEDKGASEDSREPIENREPIDIEPEINRTLPGSKERARFIGDLKDGEYVFGGMKLRKKTVRGALVYEISDSKGQIGEYSQAGALEIIDAFEQYENHRIDGLKKPVVKDNLTTEKENVQKTEKAEQAEKEKRKIVFDSVELRDEDILIIQRTDDGGIPLVGKYYFSTPQSAIDYIRKNNLDVPQSEIDRINAWKKHESETEKVETPKNIESESEDQIANGIGSSITDVIYMNASMNEKQAKLSAIAKKYGLSIKEVQEITESYIVTIARRINSENISDEEKYNKLISLYEKQPVMSKRTSTSIINQAYSTPVPMAWLLGKRIGINGKTVYEPTAGTGMLTVAGDPSTIDVNEIDIVRKKILSSEGFHRVTSEDASKSRPNRKYDRVIMNPPFGAGKETKFGNFNLTKLDHIIAARALETMKDNGKAAIIVGANTEGRDGTGKTNFSDFVFMNYLYSNFNVTDNYIVSGELYRKQGASYPVRIITVSGKRISNGDISVPKNIEIIDNWSTLYSKLKGETENAVSEKERNSDELSGNSAGQQTSNPANGRGRTSGDKGSLGKNRGDSSEGKSGRSGRTGEVDQRESESERGMGDGKSEGRVISVSPGEIDHRASGMDKGTVPVSESNRESGSKTENNHDTGRRGESGRSGESTGAVRGNALPDGRTGRNLVTGEQRGELNNEYVPASNSTSKMDVVVPKFMAQQTESALRRLKEKVGDVDKFVKDELGYNSEEELYNALSDAQIDAVAQIIESIQNGDGFIIGDQTGIGKGRQCAAVIRWAQKHNIFPVFFTKDQNLFKNMYFDGKDIGSTFKPFILASSGDKANITNDEGEVIVGLPKNQSNAMNDVLDGKDNYDCIFTSYSQFQKEGKQSEFIRNLTRSRKCIVILDESHKAAGEPKLSKTMDGSIKNLFNSKRGASSQKRGGSQTATFFFGENGILHNPDLSVVYSSATFAKRPDNMGLYFRTAIRRAVDDIESLKEVLKRGGVPLQQILASNLADEGNYIRRERDFTGVTFDTLTRDPKGISTEDFVGKYDRTAEVLQALVDYSKTVAKKINDDGKERGAYGTGATTREDKTIGQKNTFASVVHNYIAQIILASKVDSIVDLAEEAVKKGQKPVIALTNTMESAIKDFAETNGIEIGDKMSIRYSDILESALDRMYRKSEKNANGKGTTISVMTPDELGLGAEDKDMRDLIHGIDDINFPVSPIDYIKNELAKRGIKAGEVTGRKFTIDYANGETLSYRTKKEQNKNRNIDSFNSGETDAIILNESGSTGLSLHSSEKFKDKKQRVMILAQPSLDIAVMQQMLGRVLRSGQVNKPAYQFLTTSLAAEKRPMMVLSRKLQSLNANTTANNKSAVSLGEDILNKYGNQVAQEYLNDNFSVASILDLDQYTGEEEAPEDLIAKLTGRMAILPNEMQNKIIDDLIERYNNLVDFLKKTGNYELELAVHDNWDVIDSKSDVLREGNEKGSVFEQPVFMKQISIKEQKTIASAESIRKEIQDNIGESRTDAVDRIKNALSKQIEAVYNLGNVLKGRNDEYIQERKDTFLKILNGFSDFIRDTYSLPLSVTIGEDVYSGVVTGYKITGEFNAEYPVAASKIMIEFSVDDAAGRITFPFSKIRNDTVKYTPDYQKRINEIFTGKTVDRRVERYAVTGNLLRGLEYTRAGKVVSYKKKDGTTETAILLPKSFERGNLARDPKNEVSSSKDAIKYLNDSENGKAYLKTEDDLLIQKGYYGGYYASAPRNKQKGGKYFTNENILSTTGDWSSYGNRMRTNQLNEKQAEKLIDIVLKMDKTYLKKPNVQYSLRPHNQANPVFEEGEQRDIHEEAINTPHEVKSDMELEKQAERRIEGFGGIKGTIRAVLDGEYTANNDVSTSVFKAILNSSELKDFTPAERAKISDIYVNRMRSEAGRTLRAGRLSALDINSIRSIQAHVNALKNKIDAFAPSNTLRDDILKKYVIDIDSLPDDIVNDPSRLDAVLREMLKINASKLDKAYEYWINAILSAPTTHMANIIGNTANAAYELGVKRFVEATLNTVAKRKNGATFGEFREMTKAIDWGYAWKRAKVAFDREVIDYYGKLENARAAIGGETGRVIRIPGRALRAADEYAKAIILPMEATAYAYRQGRAKGYSGDVLSEYIQKQIKDSRSEANEYAFSRSLDLTFQEEPGKAVKTLIGLRESGGVMGAILKIMLPFMITPHNILKQGIRKSPLGAVNLAYETGRAIAGKRKFDANYISRVAEQLIAWGTVMAFASMDGDDDEPFITGSSAKYGSSEYGFKANKVPPYSIRFNGQYWSYRRIEPLATGLAFIADGLKAFREAKNGKDMTSVIKELVNGTKQLVVEKSFLDTFGELNRIIEDPEREPGRLLTNYAASWMPNVIRQTAQMFDDNVQDTKTREIGMGWWKDQFRVMLSRGGLLKASPKLDYFGREITRDTLSYSNPIWKLGRVFPITVIDPDENMDNADRLLWNYNMAHPDEPYYPNVPSYYYASGGETKYFTGETYQEYARKSGQIALKNIKAAIRNGVIRVNNPSKDDIALVKKIFSSAKKEVRDDLIKRKMYETK